MNIKSKFDNALKEIRQLEAQATEKAKIDPAPEHFLEMSYYSGLLNGYKFVWYILDHPREVTDKNFDLMLKEILHIKPLVKN